MVNLQVVKQKEGVNLIIKIRIKVNLSLAFYFINLGKIQKESEPKVKEINSLK